MGAAAWRFPLDPHAIAAKEWMLAERFCNRGAKCYLLSNSEGLGASGAEEAMIDSSVSLGSDSRNGDLVRLDEAHRQSGLYIIGKPGSGKTTLIENLVLQDIAAGAGVCVLDPSGDLIRRILAKLPSERIEEDIVLLDPLDHAFPFALNPFYCRDRSDPLLVNRIQGQFVDIFQKLWGSEGSAGTSWGPRLEDLLRNIALTFIENPPYTMAEISLFLSDREFRERLVANVTNDEVRLYWNDYYDRLRERDQALEVSSTLNKVRGFLSQTVVRNIVGQSKTTADFRTFMDARKVVLIPLSTGLLGPDTTQLLGSLLVLEILNAALSREELARAGKQMPRFNVYADEFQRFSSLAFATLLEEACKYEVSVTIAHQNRSQIDDRNRAATLMAGSLVVFGIDGADADELAMEFDRTPPEPEKAGQRPKRAISQSPASHLVRNSHENEAVRELVAKRLTPLVHGSELSRGELWSDYPDPSWSNRFFDEGGYYATPDTLREGLRLIDAFLVDLMEKATRHS